MPDLDLPKFKRAGVSLQGLQASLRKAMEEIGYAANSPRATPAERELLRQIGKQLERAYRECSDSLMKLIDQVSRGT